MSTRLPGSLAVGVALADAAAAQRLFPMRSRRRRILRMDARPPWR